MTKKKVNIIVHTVQAAPNAFVAALVASASPRKPKGMPRTRTPGEVGDDQRFSNETWLRWFMENHTLEDLIPLGVWKKPRFIIADILEHEGGDAAIDAMRAAYALDHAGGAIAILGAVLVEWLPPGTPIPELPANWNDRQRYRWQEYRDPSTRPQIWGTKQRDQ